MARKFLALTLPPLSLNAKLSQWGWVTIISILGLVIAWFPLKMVALLLGGTTFLIIILLNPILSVYVLIPLIPFSSLVTVSLESFKVGLMEIVLASGVSAWLLQILSGQNLKSEISSTQVESGLQSPPLLWPFLLFLGGVSLSWLNTLSIGASLIETIKWGEMLAIYLLVVALLPLRHVRWVVVVLLLTGIAQAGMGLYQFIFKVGPAGFLLFDGRFLRAYGTFAQPNPYAGYLGLILPIALSLVMWSLEWKPFRFQMTAANLPHKFSTQHLQFKILMCALFSLTLGLLLAALFATQSRGAWVGFAVATGVVLMVRSKKTAIILTTLTLALAIFALLGALDLRMPTLGAGAAYRIIIERFAAALSIFTMTDISTLEVNDANFATVERLAHWQAAREMWRDHLWLGVGFGNYGLVYPAYAVGRWLDPLGHAHNYLLNIGAEAGLVGLIAYLIFWILTFRVIWLTMQRSRSFERAVAAGGLGSMVHLQVHNLFDNLYVQGMYLQIAIILALISVALTSAPKLNSRDE